MAGLGPHEMQALAELLCPGGEEEEEGFLATKSTNSTHTDKHKSKAKPNVKTILKVGSHDDCDIWEEKDLRQGLTIKDINDQRVTPEFEVLFSQKVGAEDVYLGLSDRDPSTDQCETLVIQLPGALYSQISLETLEDRIFVQSPQHKLNLSLPYSVETESGTARWISSSSSLVLRLPIRRKIEYVQM
ncbi:hypothetical protein Esti_004294 [Eimeria stiedai]